MKQALILFVLAFLTISCSPRLTPFTDQLKREQGWDENDLKKIQYYLSEDVTLWRQVVEGESKIEGGTIKLKNGKKVEEIIFKKGTPGVLLFAPKNNRFAIGFETSDQKYLMFGPSKRYDEYVLLAADWNRDIGKISYGDRLYYTDEDSAFARLLVDLRAINKKEVDRKTVEGRKVKS